MAALPSPAPRPVVFDFDGTLADTEPVWDVATAGVMARHGFHLAPADVAATRGMGPGDRWAYLAARTGAAFDPDALSREVEDEVRAACARRIEPVAGAVETVERLWAFRHPLAIASASSRRTVLSGLRGLGIARRFRTVVTREDIANPKPHPEPYLLAAARLGVDPAACVAVEDSVPGATSARAAGMLVVGIAHPGAKDPSGIAHHVVRSFAELRDPDLWAEVFGG